MSVDVIDTLQRDFAVFDTAARGGREDGRISREDLEAVANGSQYSSQQRAAAQHLLADEMLYTQLDTAVQGGGLYRADGIISRQDIETFIANQAMFQDTSAFRSDGPVIAPGVEADSGPDATPQEAAAFVLHVHSATGSFGDSLGSATAAFMHFVRDNQGDVAWMQEFFGSLGAEATAQYLGHVADPGRYSDGSSEFALSEVASASEALLTLHRSSVLNNADLGRLVEHWAMAPGDFNPGIAQMFANLEGLGSTELQTVFFRATTELALAERIDIANAEFPYSESAIGRLSEGDRESLAAAGAHVLAQTGAVNQTTALVELGRDGGMASIDQFITLAMSQPTRAWTVDALTADARHEVQLSGTDRYDIDYDGVTTLVQSLSIDTTYRGGPDRYLPPSPYSYAALQEVRDQVFYSASDALDGNREWAEDTELLDGLSQTFLQDFDRMIAEATTANGERLDYHQHPFPNALENFAQYALFTEPTGTRRDAVSDFLVNRMSTIIHDIGTLSDAEFVDRHGSTKLQQSGMVGQVLGYVQNGMDQAIEASRDEAASQRNGLEFAINLAWALGKDGLKVLPGGNVLSHILPSEVTGSGSYQMIQGQVEGLIRDGLTDQAAALLIEEFPNLRVDAALNRLQGDLEGVVPADDTTNTSYATVIGQAYDSARDQR